MEEIKESIITQLNQLMEKKMVFHRIGTNSEKQQELTYMEKLIDDIENDFSVFEKRFAQVKIGRQNYEDDLDYFEAEIDKQKNEIKEMRSSLIVSQYGTSHGTLSQPSLIQTEVSQRQSLTSQIRVGDQHIKEGRIGLDNIRNDLLQINEELMGIEDEINTQREKLLKVKTKIHESHSIVKQSRKILSGISKMLYHDTIMKFFIVLISIVLVFIIFLAICVKLKQKTIKDKRRGEIIMDEPMNFDEIDEQLFIDLKNGVNVFVHSVKQFKPKDNKLI